MEGGKVLSQEDFNTYIRKLDPKESCQFVMTVGIGLCNQDSFICPYKSKESFTTSKGIHRECKREETLRFKKILGA